MGITPVFGIRTADGSTKANQLPAALATMASDIEAALLAAEIPPTAPAMIWAGQSAAARDAKFGVPTNATARLALQNSGAQMIRTDLGYTEQYFASRTDSGSNPGGRAVAGWYPLRGQLKTKVTRSTAQNFPTSSNQNMAVQWDAAPILIAGAWSTAFPTRVYLPYAGDWEINAAAATSGADNALLRSQLFLNGSPVGDSMDNKMGTTGITDPFVRPATVITTTNATSYLELMISSNGVGPTVKLLANSASIIAKF